MFTQINGNGLFLDLDTADMVRAATPATPSIPRTHRMFQLVQAGVSNRDAVTRIRAEYGDVPTNTASIAWVRQAIRDAAAGKQTKQAAYAVKTMAKLQ